MKELLYYAIYHWLVFHFEPERLDYILLLKLTLNDMFFCPIIVHPDSFPL